MKVIALCLIALIAVNATNIAKKYPLNYSKTRSIMNVMMEVEAKLKNKSPLDAINSVLADYRSAVNTEQVNHDEIYQTQKAECDSEHAFRQGQIQDATNVLRDSSAQLKSCETQKIRANNDLSVTESQTFSTEEQQTVVVAMRTVEQANSARRAQSYADAVDVLDEAQDILGSIFTGDASFVDLTRVAKKMLTQSASTNSHKLYAPIFASFAQLATNAKQVDDSSLEQVAALIDSLRSTIQDSYDAFVELDAAAVQAYNDQTERLENTLNRLHEQFDRLTAEVNDLTQCIGTQAAIAQTASNKLSRNQQLYDQAVALCHTFENEYTYATQTRRHELQLVTELEALVERRFAQVEDENAQRSVDIRDASL